MRDASPTRRAGATAAAGLVPAGCVQGGGGPAFPYRMSGKNDVSPTRDYVDLVGDRGTFLEAAPGVPRISGAWDAAVVRYRPGVSGEGAVEDTAERMCATIGRTPTAVAHAPEGRAAVARFACV